MIAAERLLERLEGTLPADVRRVLGDAQWLGGGPLRGLGQVLVTSAESPGSWLARLQLRGAFWEISRDAALLERLEESDLALWREVACAVREWLAAEGLEPYDRRVRHGGLT